MKKSLIVLLHLAFWGCYFILIMVLLGVYFHADENPEGRIAETFQIVLFFAFVPSLISFYCFYLFIFPKYFQKKKFLLAFLFGIGFSFLGALFGMAMLGTVVTEDCGDDQDTISTFFGVWCFMAFIAFIAGLIALLVRGFITWFEEVKLREALKNKNQAMELALLKAQLDPHFLFNTINNIDVLMLKNAGKASEYLNKLSDIMRFMLFETKHEEVALSKEIEYIEKYIELQKIRTANTQYVDYSVTGSPNGHTIAPMIFIPFIENAFKHTTNKKLENAISIHINIQPEHVKMVCENKFDPNRLNKENSNGLGNDLIEKRLNLIYPNNHQLNVQNSGTSYRVELSVNS